MTTPDFFRDLPSLKLPKKLPDFFEEIPEEPPEMPTEEPKNFLRELGRAAALRAQIAPPAEVLPQIGAGALEELSLGSIDVMKPETPAGEFSREAGRLALGFPLLMRGLNNLLRPVGWLGRLLGTAAAGGTRRAVKDYFKKGEINPKDVATEGAIWGAIEGTIQAVGLGLTTKRAIDFISKRTGKSKADVARFLADKFKSRFKKRFKTEPTPRNMELLPPEEVSEVVEGSIADIQKEAARLREVPKLLEAPREIPKVPEVISTTEPVEAQLLKDNKVTEAFAKLAAKVDVEAPFKRIGATETGFRVKSYFDQVSKNIAKGKEVQKDIKKLKLSEEEMSSLVLASERATPPKDPKLKEGYKIVRKFFDDSLAELKKAGVLKEGFVENRIQQIKDQIEEVKSQLGKARTSQAKKNYRIELEDLNTELDDVKDIKFVSIPANLWFDNKVSTDPALARRVVRFLNKKRRKTATIKDLIDAKVISPKDINVNEIISHYSRKAGRDIALGKVIQAAKNEGLATLKERPGYLKIPGFIAPELAKYYVHPAFADYIQGYTEPKRFSNWEKLVRRTKGWSFYNPVIMPVNDLYQHAAAILGDVRNLPTIGGSWVKAFKDVKNKTPAFWDAYENGLFSQPFIPEDMTFKAFTSRMSKETSSSFLNLIKNIPFKLHDKLYDAIGSVAWGTDRMIRMATYNHLLKQGLSPRDAAQTAALFHGDYASVPPATRRQLNKFLWTPTFKIVMGKMQKDAIKGAYKVGAAIAKGEDIPKAELAKFKGLLGALAIIAGLDLWLTSHGFKRETFGLRYSTPTVVDRKKKEFWLNLSNPLNLLWKFAWRGYDTFTKPGVEKRFWSFIRRNKFEYAIPTQILWELTENQSINRKKIYETADSFPTQLGKMAVYSMKRALPFLGKVDKTNEFVKPEAREAMQKELGIIPSYLPSMFPYITDPKKVRQRRLVQKIQRQFLEKAKRYRREGKELTEKDWQRYKAEIYKAASD